MSLFSQSTYKNTELVIVYDIGSASVGAALVLLENNKKPNIIYTVERDMPLKYTPNAERLEGAMYKTLRLVSEKVIKNGMPHLRFTPFGKLKPSHAYITFASPWYASQTRIIRESFERPKNIRMNDIMSRVTRERKAFIKDENVVRIVGDDEHALIEERIVQILANGYETSSPEGVTAQSLVVSVLFSVVPRRIMDGVAEEVGRICPACEIIPNTFPLVGFDVLRDMVVEHDNFLFIDISGEVTDVSLVHEDTLFETETFPIGKKTIVRHIADALRTSESEALSLLELSPEEEFAGRRKKQIEHAVASARDMWRRGYEHACAEVSSSYPLSGNVFFVSDRDVEKFFFSIFTDADIATNIQSVVQAVDVPFLHEQCSVTHNAVHNSFLMLGAIFAAKIHRDT
jgi:hypothetical protein